MKKFLVILLALCVVSVVQADLTVSGDTWAPTNGWMNVTAVEGNWGSGWGIPDLRTNEIGGQWNFQTNVNGHDDNPTDPYWAPGHIIMEALSYTETSGLSGQNVTFNFEIASNNLAGVLDAAGNPIVTEAFIKTLNPDAGWATVQELYEPMTVGPHSFSLLIDTIANPVVQVGFRVISGNDASGSATADLAAVLAPEPATLVLLGLGGLLLRKRK